MRRIRIRALLIIFVLMSVFLPGNAAVSAEESGRAELSAGDAIVRSGQEIEVILSVDGYGDAETGINAIKGTLEIDSDIFEKPDQEDFELLDSWENIRYNPENGQFVLSRRAGSPEGGDVLRLRLTAGEKLSSGETYVRVTGLAASEGKREIFPETAELALIVVSEQVPEAPEPETEEEDSPEEPADTEEGENAPEDSSGTEEESVPDDPSGAGEEEGVPGNLPGAEEEDSSQGSQTAGESLPGGSQNTGDGEPVLEEDADGEEESLPEADSDTEEETGPEKQPENSQETQDEQSGGILTGIAISGLCAAAVLLLIGIAVIRKKKGHGKGTRLLAGAVIITAAAAFTAGGVRAFGAKGDLNGDGMVDYSDVYLLKKHLVALWELPESKRNLADMNSDHALSVIDLSLLIHKAENMADYEVTITDAMDRFYYEQQEEFSLKFHAQVSDGGVIDRIIMNGEEYEVYTEEGSLLYTVPMKAADLPGIQEFHITKAVLKHGQEADVNHTTVIDVLKRTPSVENFLTEEIAGTSQIQVSFLLKDEDDALTSAGMELLKNTDGEMTRIDVRDAAAGENEFLLDLEEDTAYTLHISAGYNRDSDLLEKEEDYSGSLAVLREIRLNVRYQFSFGNMITETEDGTAAERFGRNEPIVLRFESSSGTKYKPEWIVVNGKAYRTGQSGNGYTVLLDGFARIGEHEILAEQVILDNGKAFSLTKDNRLTVTIEKENPAVTELAVQEDGEPGKIHVSFVLTDPDHALSNQFIRIRNAEGKTVGEQPFGTEGASSGNVAVSVSLTDAGLTSLYTVQILADCDLSADGTKPVREAVLAQEEIKARPRAAVLAGRPENAYAQKGGTVSLLYEISDNVSAELTGLVVNQIPLGVSRMPDGTWKADAKAAEQAGEQIFGLSHIMYADGTVVTVSHSIPVEVMKSAPQVTGYQTEDILSRNQVRIRFQLEDEDGSFLSGRVQLVSGGGAAVTAEEQIGQIGEQEFFLDAKEEQEYIFRVLLSWKQTEDGERIVTDETVYTERITVSRDRIQFKDVTAERLYYNGGSGIREIEVLDITGGLPEDIENYYAVIEMEHMPDFYAGIREFYRDADSGRVYAVLDQADVIVYGGDGSVAQEYAFPLAFRDDGGVHPLIQSAEELFAQMSADPDGSYELTQDLDASGIAADMPAVAGVFTGELNGNGYQIRNLSTSLFGTLSGAKVHDLILENAQITTSRSGILAEAIQNGSVIERVFIMDSGISGNVDGVGAFAGSLSRSAIRESASVNVSVKGLVAVGGIVGKTNDGAVIENCYVTGTLEGSYDHPTLGSRVGGIAGWHGGGEIRSCFAGAKIFAPAKKGNGGLIGGPNTGSPVIENCLSLSTGAGYRIAGFDVLENAKNVYEYSGSESATNITDANREQVKETDAVYDRSLYADALGWNEDIWDLTLLTYGKRPNLKAASRTENTFGIPSYEQILKSGDYDPGRERAYANMAKLMPFADVRAWIESGNRLSETDDLAARTVRFVLPLAPDGTLVSGLRRSDPDQIERIRVVFETGKMREYEVSFQRVTGDIAAVYQISGTKLRYQFRHYLSDPDEDLVREAVRLVSGFDYAAEIAALTPEEESRLYTDYYNETIKPASEEFVTKLLLSQEEYPFYCNNEAVQALARKRILDGTVWMKLLYGYNYYDKWYHIDYGGVALSDLLYFGGDLPAPGMSARVLSEKLLEAKPELRETHRTVTFYNSVLREYTGKELTDFLGELSYQAAGYDDPSDWFADQFDGILKEQPAAGGADGIRYRIWDILCGIDDARKSIILPILTAPQEDMYLISMPSQLMIGSLNRYPDYLNKDGRERERMEEIIDVYAKKMGIFYGVSSTWTDSSADILNSFVNIQYDTRLGFPESEAADAGDQDKNKTRDPVMKWVYEANNTISAKNGSAASADGTNVYWMLDAALGTSDYSFFTFSHETAHNQDGRYFYQGAGRREGTGGEAHADGNIAQEMKDGCMVFNISKVNDIGTEMTNNFSYERINSAEKLESYYREMFETGYVLDYLAAMAFLRLTPQQQAAVAVQAVHTPGGNHSFHTEYRSLSVQELEQMKLTDIEDLWDNRISVRNIAAGSSEKVNTATDGSYGFESFYNMNWYQSHNDDGSPDTHSFKRLGMEMLGLGGYEGGYVIYMSALSKTDLDALRKITGDPDITWKSYKMSRFQTVKENLDKIPYFDAETVIEQFRSAFERDAQNRTGGGAIAVKRMLYGLVKRVTGDFSDGGIYEAPDVISVTSAEELIRLAGENPYGWYRLDADLDFTGIEAEQGSYIPERFVGILDGNGHRIKGMSYPLFGNLLYADVKNLILEAPSYENEAQAVLAVKACQTAVGNLTAEGISRPGMQEQDAKELPVVKTKEKVYYEYGVIEVTAGEADSEADGPLPVTEEENEEQERREEGDFGGE